MIDKLRSIAIFSTVVDQGSFRGAALNLGLAPSRVSEVVSQLEKDLGVTLLYRSTRQLALTHEGRQLKDAAKDMLAAAETGRVIKIKKGQFLAPWDMKNVVAKVTDSGNPNVLVTERGASFGYNTLVTDYRGLPSMARDIGAPIIFDATHSVQHPGGQGGSSGGQREMVPTVARAAVAVGVAGIFAETHQDPDNAPSDGPNMIPLPWLKTFLEELVALDKVAKARETLHWFAGQS